MDCFHTLYSSTNEGGCVMKKRKFVYTINQDVYSSLLEMLKLLRQMRNTGMNWQKLHLLPRS